jgi:hypothetical protein
MRSYLACCSARTSVPVPALRHQVPLFTRPLFSHHVKSKPGRCSRPELHAPLYFRTSNVRLSTVHSLPFPDPAGFLFSLFRSYLAVVARPELQCSPARYLSCFMQSLSVPHASKTPNLYSSHPRQSLMFCFLRHSTGVITRHALRSRGHHGIWQDVRVTLACPPWSAAHGCHSLTDLWRQKIYE